MNKLSVTLLAMGLTAAGAALADENVLTPFRADYSLQRNSLGLGTSSFTLSRDGDGYLYKSAAHASGLASLFSSSTITQESRFTLVDGRPRAASYRYEDSGKSQDAESIRFDWDKRSATTEENGQQKAKPLTPDTSDVQLIQLMLAADVAAGKVEDDYRLLDHGQITGYTAKPLPDAALKAAGKTYSTKVVQLNNAERGRTITVWLAPELHYLPVQIQQAQTGKATITLTLQKATFDAGSLSARN
ncbi:MAG TPA: DUF3108 domain-containing protein [Gammaproteobacteria bacterium]|jgi:hypothetical protein|nr:DUF3108 domain-containing protein [Gammaproteobacteria bacterium]